ncbi:MAG TPA: hypothetical protein VM915_15530, partial [Verrucomicrobiae bacterium]|nr:hypothetical protein [Verrucomicrobiae bacterium]
MRLSVPRSPSDRDFEIYYDVIAREKKQAEVAKEYNLSPARVSQIVRRVGDFIADYAPLAERSPAQQIYLARDAFNVVLMNVATLAQNTFVEQHGWCRKSEESNTPGRRPPRADPRLLSCAIQATQQQVENTVKLAEVGEEVKEELLKSEDTREDVEVEDLVGACKDAQRQARRFEKAGLQPPVVPPLDEVALEVTIRNSVRKERNSEYSEHLPEVWRKTIASIYDKP